ncbi:hypothetical protein BJY54_002924 [Streptomyces nodosus]|nr:hypothetical protein [Streptomyces nodosus]
MPPALLAGVPSHLHQGVDDPLVLDLVDPAQIPDVALADAAAAVLQPADLRLGDEQPLRDLLGRHALEFTEPAQLLAQPAPPDCGIDIGRHGRAPPAACLYFAYLLLSRLPPSCLLPLGNSGYAHSARRSGGRCDGGVAWARHRRGPRGARGPCRRPDVRSPRPVRAGGSRTGTAVPARTGCMFRVVRCPGRTGSGAAGARGGRPPWRSRPARTTAPTGYRTMAPRGCGLRLSGPRPAPWIRGAAASGLRGPVPWRP